MPENKKPIILYMHAGSGNHGCEAIVNGLCHILKERPTLISFRREEDLRYSLAELCDIYGERSFDTHKAAHLFYYGYRLLTKDAESFLRYRYGGFLSRKNQAEKYPVAISIGGDNYCYDVMQKDLALANAAFRRQGTRTVLLGCSIEPELLTHIEIREDLKNYHTIIAREGITFDALKETFGDGGPRIFCVPDPAFALTAAEQVSVPDGFSEGNTVGINVSPMICDNETKSGITLTAYRELVRYLLEKTDLHIALIPHVVWKNNDDRGPLNELYEYAKEVGAGDRVCRIEDADCRTLKGVIQRCRFFVGARTHATIAAYSTGVPTLVVGYSVKARGIARDLFPGWDEDRLVVPVQSLSQPNDLVRAFQALAEDETHIREHLARTMPDYVNRAYEVKRILRELTD